MIARVFVFYRQTQKEENPNKFALECTDSFPLSIYCARHKETPQSDCGGGYNDNNTKFIRVTGLSACKAGFGSIAQLGSVLLRGGE